MTKIDLENIKRAQNADTLIIGGGRMATQFKEHLKKLDIPFSSWLKSEGNFSLGGRMQNSKRILLLIPDKLIIPFIEDNRIQGKPLIHFSATIRDPRILGFHPLGSFTREQTVDFSTIHFHGVHPESVFREALPYLSNAYRQLSEQDMQIYHALCVVGGNFSAILWNAFFKEMKKLGVSDAASRVYLEMITQNIARNPNTAVSGPLVRKDFPTLEKNITALSEKPELQEIYKDFVRTFADSEYLT